MLLEFKAKNYKSFKEEFVFSMVPAVRITGLDYSIAKMKGGKKVYKALSSAIIYGPNAAGKTNIIGAMDTFKKIVKRGHIRNEQTYPNIAAGTLELIPFYKSAEETPIEFDISFIFQEIHFRYTLAFSVGSFMDKGHEREIVHEELYVNNVSVFERTSSGVELHISHIEEWWNDSVKGNAQSTVSIAASSLNPSELFLMYGFKTIVSQKLSAVVSQWFDEQFQVFYSANAIMTRKQMEEDKRNRVEVDPIISSAVKIFGSDSEAIGYVYSKEGEQSEIASFIKGNKNVILNADVFESLGTIRLINEFPILWEALLYGHTVVIDEFDASLHPMALMSIINVFHNDQINVRHAQLIFNTHNPIFLNANLFRRDEIKFVERNSETGISELYQLSDFGTSGTTGVRKGEDYMKNYFINRYGAIKDVDFSPIFEQIPLLIEKETQE